jgi:ubiquinone/menaquinone biosynthesis C-methylase UbiE
LTFTSLNTQSAYTIWAPNYDTDVNLTRDLDRDMTARMLGSKRYALTVEAACGTGKNTPFLASISGSVLALDFSPGMLALARERVRATNVQFQQTDLRDAWPCADESATLVSCNLVLEHIENLFHAFSEAARVLAVGGTFFVSELHPHKQYLGSQARFMHEQQVETRIEAFVHHLSDYLRAAEAASLKLEKLEESWHAEEMGQSKPPRLISLLFRKCAPQG